MISLKDLIARVQPFFKSTEVFIKNAKPILNPTQIFSNRHFESVGFFAKRVYAVPVVVVSKTIELLSLTVREVAHFTLFTAEKICILYNYFHRKIYVWNVLSVRYRWYMGKKGNLYNPKINATISPTWKCTWNLKRNDDHFSELESKEDAQSMAFKLWMKKRLLQKRLQHHNPETRISIKFTEKLILNPKILSNKVQLRTASPNDTDELLMLMKQFEVKKNDPELSNRIRTYLEKTNHHILVATKGKTIVGFIAFVIYDLFLLEGKRCRIEGMVVDANQQDLTVKRKLMQAAELFAIDNKSTVIDLIDSACRTKDGTYDFYKYLGYNNNNNRTNVYLRKEL